MPSKLLRLARALRLRKPQNPVFFTFVESHVVLKNCKFFGRNQFGFRSYANDSSFRNAVIGRFCSIGRRCSIGAAKHRIDLLSTHPCCDGQNTPDLPTHIGNDVWIGDNVVILSGIKIGDGAIVGAGSVVTRDVQNYSIVGGVPARLIKFRFSEEICSLLSKSQWWKYGDIAFKILGSSDSFKEQHVVRLHSLNMLDEHYCEKLYKP